MSKKTFLGLDENGKVIRVDDEKVEQFENNKFIKKNKQTFTDDELREKQREQVFKDEDESDEPNYMDEASEEEVDEILSELFNETDSALSDIDLEEQIANKQVKLNKRHRRSYISQEDSFKENYDFSKEVDESSNKKSFGLFSIFKKKKSDNWLDRPKENRIKKQLNKKDTVEENNDVDKETLLDGDNNINEVQEVKKEVKEEIKGSSPLKFGFRVILFVIFVFIVGVFGKYLLTDNTVVIENNNNNVVVDGSSDTDSSTVNVVKPKEKTYEEVSDFLSYINKSNEYVAVVAEVTSKEYSVFKRYLSGKINREQLLTYYVQSLNQKETIYTEFSKLKPPSKDLYKLEGIFVDKMNGYINITKDVLYHINYHTEKSNIEENYRKFIQSDISFDEDLYNESKLMLQIYNVVFTEKEGKLIY